MIVTLTKKIVKVNNKKSEIVNNTQIIDLKHFLLENQ